MAWASRLVQSLAILAVTIPPTLSNPCPGSNCSNNPASNSVKTTNGQIIGHPGPRFPDVNEFLGVPYASAPIGDLRFAAPVNLHSSKTVVANHYGPNCPTSSDAFPPILGMTPQEPKIMSGFLTVNGTQSEDCLYLNIWAKSGSSKLKPVLLWIHGGRFVITSAESPFYDGQALASKHDVIVVTINYRLNIFGFSGAPGLPQNVGLLDQRMAVEWVHRNIQAFGGDPDRITIFGSSAGGTSVDLYSYAWARDPIVSGIISHSGTALSYKPNTPEQSSNAFFSASKSLGCGGHTEKPEQVVQCMRQKPFEDLFNASLNVPLVQTITIPEPVFHPVVDEITVFSDYAKRSSEGKFARVPFLVTCNNNEAGFYRLAAYASNITVSNQTWNEFNLAAFTCPSGRAARDRVAHGVPAWQARYFGDWENLRIYPGSGTYHGSDIPMIFGNAEKITGLPDSDPEKKVSRYMASAWVAFATDPYNGLKKFGWPQYNSHEKTLVGLAYDNKLDVQFFDPQEFDSGCAELEGRSLIVGNGAI
ncbi:Carboxylesterase type B [Penicillium malachiteum]|uniref:Carboxylesterase type B n=1 Tax=Penicillium malachiteum TaxID=1324776 RepID=UPI0025468DD4|nr:Carboxylesterase type B [Penicillium malachiteum]KAJ5714725.1 Carboxylesterase type B [Penicillium malachiteum]